MAFGEREDDRLRSALCSKRPRAAHCASTSAGRHRPAGPSRRGAGSGGRVRVRKATERRRPGGRGVPRPACRSFGAIFHPMCAQPAGPPIGRPSRSSCGSPTSGASRRSMPTGRPMSCCEAVLGRHQLLDRRAGDRPQGDQRPAHRPRRHRGRRPTSGASAASSRPAWRGSSTAPSEATPEYIRITTDQVARYQPGKPRIETAKSYAEKGRPVVIRIDPDRPHQLGPIREQGGCLMYLDALSFLEEEREAWRPFEALGELDDSPRLDRQVDKALRLERPRPPRSPVVLAAAGARGRTRAGGPRAEPCCGPTLAGPKPVPTTRPWWRGARHRCPRCGATSSRNPGELDRGPQIRWLKNPDMLKFFLTETTDHYQDHGNDLAEYPMWSVRQASGVTAMAGE